MRKSQPARPTKPRDVHGAWGLRYCERHALGYIERVRVQQSPARDTVSGGRATDCPRPRLARRGNVALLALLASVACGAPRLDLRQTRLAAEGDALCVVRRGQAECNRDTPGLRISTPPGDDLVDISIGPAGGVCAVHKAGGLWCSQGKVSAGDAVRVIDTGSMICVQHRDTRVDCSNETTRVDVPEFMNASALSGGSQACAIISGRVRCMFVAPEVFELPITDVAAVDATQTQGCAVRAGGQVSCWENDRVVQQVDGVGDALQVAVGSHFACALCRSGRAVCWNLSEPRVLREFVFESPVRLAMGGARGDTLVVVTSDGSTKRVTLR